MEAGRREPTCCAAAQRSFGPLKIRVQSVPLVSACCLAESIISAGNLQQECVWLRLHVPRTLGESLRI